MIARKVLTPKWMLYNSYGVNNIIFPSNISLTLSHYTRIYMCITGSRRNEKELSKNWTKLPLNGHINMSIWFQCTYNPQEKNLWFHFSSPWEPGNFIRPAKIAPGKKLLPNWRTFRYAIQALGDSPDYLDPTYKRVFEGGAAGAAFSAQYYLSSCRFRNFFWQRQRS